MPFVPQDRPALQGKRSAKRDLSALWAKRILPLTEKAATASAHICGASLGRLKPVPLGLAFDFGVAQGDGLDYGGRKVVFAVAFDQVGDLQAEVAGVG